MDNNDLLKDANGNNFIDMNSHADWIDFFIIFSRFEYALKRSGYARMNGRNLEIEWDRFGQKVKGTFATLNSDELREAIEYLKTSSPKKQYMDGKQLKWCSLKEDYQNFQTLINAIKRVRNNLFHGGKFAGPVEDPTRNQELIKHSITVLKYLLCCSSECVKRAYKESLA